MNEMYQVILIHFGWVSLHYTSAHMYTRYCTPLSLVGVAFSPVMTMTPHCQALRWCILHGASSINSMWMTIGTWAIAKLAAYQVYYKHDNDR